MGRVHDMPARFGESHPPWARRWLFWIAIITYAVVAVMGLIAMTWPRVDMNILEWVSTRTAGLLVTISAMVCLASYPTHRWRWELVSVWVLGISLSVYVFVVLSYAPLASRGLLLTALSVVVLGAYARGIAAIGFGRRTTATAEREQTRVRFKHLRG